jgi:hypothetical protein
MGGVRLLPGSWSQDPRISFVVTKATYFLIAGLPASTPPSPLTVADGLNQKPTDKHT